MPTQLSIASDHVRMSTAQTTLAPLQGCNSLGRVKSIHTRVFIHGLQSDPSISGKLLHSCPVSLSGCLAYARTLFDRIECVIPTIGAPSSEALPAAYPLRRPFFTTTACSGLPFLAPMATLSRLLSRRVRELGTNGSVERFMGP